MENQGISKLYFLLYSFGVIIKLIDYYYYRKYIFTWFFNIYCDIRMMGFYKYSLFFSINNKILYGMFYFGIDYFLASSLKILLLNYYTWGSWIHDSLRLIQVSPVRGPLILYFLRNYCFLLIMFACDKSIRSSMFLNSTILVVLLTSLILLFLWGYIAG